MQFLKRWAEKARKKATDRTAQVKETAITALKDRTNAIGQKMRSRYESIERFLPPIFFAAGFIWDSLTLTRIDRLLDNIILLAYLLLLGALIVITNMTVSGTYRSPFVKRFAKWYPLGIQFFLGGLLSGYVVFYFQSASMTRTSLFLALLAFLLIANEFLHDRLENFLFQVSLYYLVGYSFFIFFIPVILKTMSYWTFLASGLLSSVITGGIVWFLWWRKAITQRWKLIGSGVIMAFIFILLNVFYVKNWIPPVPLSLKSGGIYRTVEKEDDTYRLTYAKPVWHQGWRRSESEYQWSPGDRVVCFTAIFAPTELKKKVYHHWKLKDNKKNKWVQTDRIGFEITGGRSVGWRGYTAKENVQPGVWRIDVRTEDGLLLGEVNFLIREAETPVTETRMVEY